MLPLLASCLLPRWPVPVLFCHSWKAIMQCCTVVSRKNYKILSLCRSLRQRPGLQMQRVRCDLRDFDPAGLWWQATQAGVAAQPAASEAGLHCPDCRARWVAGHGVCLAHRPPAGQRQGQNGHQLPAQGQAGSRASEYEAAVLCCSAEQQRTAAAGRESSKVQEGLSHGLGPGAPWVAHGKHLCGAATDFALRCCSRAVGHRQQCTPRLVPPPKRGRASTCSSIRQSLCDRCSGDPNHTQICQSSG